MVGSIPVAVVIAIVAAVLSARHRRLGRALMVLAALVLAGMMLAGRHLSAPLGAPDLECSGEGGRGHRVRGTQEAECLPRYADGEVGFNSQGKVIWFIELTDETFLTF